MKKTIGFILVAVLIMLATVPAFASPACPFCSGCLRAQKYENIRAANGNYQVVEGTAYNPFVGAVTTAYFIVRDAYRDVYRVCDKNSSHKVFVRTELFTLRQLSGY